MKILDYVIAAIFVIGLVVLCFMQKCHLDIIFLIIGFVAAALSVAAIIVQKKKNNDHARS